MRSKDIKILWGRSGNRCAMCKLELTPAGDVETLGEMAHIVAKSTDGPRGNSSLSDEERDSYSNLILLCPTHHADIDKNHTHWPVAKLMQAKALHEAWVSEQLATGNISVTQLDNSDFLELRKEVWADLCRDHVAIVLSLTPLRIWPDQIDAMSQKLQKVLEKAEIRVSDINTAQRVNRFHTRPTEFGLVNEKFPALPDRSGHSIHLFNSGHCEYLFELGASTDRITEVAKQRKGGDVLGARYVLRYTDLAEVVDDALTWLHVAWQEDIPLEYMELRCTLLNVRDTTLYSYEDDWRNGVYGHPVRSNELEYQNVISRTTDFEQLSFEVLRWIARCYGLVLHRKLSNEGYFRPTKLR